MFEIVIKDANSSIFIQNSNFYKVKNLARAKLEIRSVTVYQKHRRRQVADFRRILWWTQLLKRNLKISEYVSWCSVFTWIQCISSENQNNFPRGLAIEPQRRLTILAFGKFDNYSQKQSKLLKNAKSFKGLGRRWAWSDLSNLYISEISVKNCFT